MFRPIIDIGNGASLDHIHPHSPPNICKALKERVRIPPLINAMHNAFDAIDWYTSTTPVPFLQEQIMQILAELTSPRSAEFQENLENIV